MSSESQAGEHHFTEEIMMDKDEDRGRPLQHVPTSGTTVTMTPEMFEKLYLTPKTPRVGDNVKRFANPTPIGLVGFVISTMTFSMVLMGWGGANGLYGVAGIFFFTGPVLLVLALIFEWIMSNFFPMMVMGLFAVFWLSFGLLQLPTLNLAAAYSSTGTNMAEGLASKEYNAVVGIYCVVWGFALLTFFVFTLRTNVVFASIFGLVTVGIWVLAGAYFRVSTGDFEMAGRLQKGGAALLFVVGLLGWYMTVVIMAAEMRMGFNLPVGDLSHYWPKTDTELGKEEV